MIKRLKVAYPEVTQPWYADYDGALGMFNNIQLYFNSLKQFGLGCGYYPKPLENVIFVRPGNLSAGNEFGLSRRFKVFMGLHYLGGFIGDDKSKCDWLNIACRSGIKHLCDH